MVGVEEEEEVELGLYEGDEELGDIIRLLNQVAALTKQRRREDEGVKSNSPSSYVYCERREEEELEMKDEFRSLISPPNQSPPSYSSSPHTKKEEEKKWK